MITRVGLAILSDAICAVALRRGTIVWSGEARLDGRSLEEAVGWLLEQIPVGRWSRAAIHAAVGPHAAQVKRVAGLPEVEDPEVLTAVIRESIGTFFRRNGVPLIATGARADGTGAALAAVIELPCIEALRAACRRRGWRLECVAPAAVALPHVIEDPAFTWTDGGLTLEIAQQDAMVSTIRTRPATAADASSPPQHPVAPLANLGVDVYRYAPALGVTSLPATEPLAVTAETGVMQSAWERRRPVVWSALLLAFAVAAVALSPVASIWSSRRAAARLAALSAERWQTVVAALTELERVTRVLDGAAALAETRSPVTPLLAGLAQALDDGTVVISLELTEESGELVVLTPRAERAAAAVSRVAGIAGAELAGSTRRETVAGREVQRATIRFRRGVAEQR